MFKFYTALFAVLLILSCKEKNSFTPKTVAQPEGEVIAKVGTRKLYSSEIKGLTDSKDGKDSLNVINAYVEQWVRRMVVLDEAEKVVSNSLNIDQLVEDYRSSLILHNYKVQLVENKLDTVVSKQQLEDFYSKNKEKFKLGENVAKVYIAKISPKANQKILKKFYHYWDKGNIKKVDQKIKELSTFTFTDKDRWVTANELSEYLPDNINPNRLKKGNTYKKYKGVQYYVKVFDLIKANRTAPLSLVEDQVKKTIISARKKDLLENFQEDLYQKALNQNKIEVYNN